MKITSFEKSIERKDQNFFRFSCSKTPSDQESCMFDDFVLNENMIVFVYHIESRLNYELIYLCV